MNFKNSENGSILIVVLSMISIVALIIFTGSFIFISGNKKVKSSAKSNQALYIAEAGVEYAVKKYVENWDYSPTSDAITMPLINNSFFIITEIINSDPLTKIIVSEGNVYIDNSTGEENAYKTKKIKVEITKSGLFPFDIKNALASKSTLDISASEIHISSADPNIAKSNIYAKGDIKISAKKDSNIDGAVYSEEGSVSLNSNITLPNPTPIPEIDNFDLTQTIKYWKILAQNEGFYISSTGDTKVRDVNLGQGKVLYSEGDLTFNGDSSITGEGIIYANGNITFNGSANTPNNPNLPFRIFVAKNKITLNGTTSGKEAFGAFISVDGTIHINGHTTITGALFASVITSKNNSGKVNITYNPKLNKKETYYPNLPTATGIKSWKEIN
jgi:type II secretory pathway pseudopilin PulG